MKRVTKKYRRSKFNRKSFKWGNAYGARKTVDKLEDSHILNLVGYIKTKLEDHYGMLTDQSIQYYRELLILFVDEVYIRDLEYFLTLKRLGLMPWETAHTAPDGTRRIWNHQTNSTIIVSK